MPRLFTAIEIPKAVAAHLSLLRGGLMRARWIDAENYHVTLRFIGDVDMVVAQESAAELARVHRPEFTLRFTGIGPLGTRKHHSVVATIEESRPLMELQAEHERIQRERYAVQAQRQTEEAACYRRFTVEDCLRGVRARSRDALARLRTQEIELNDAERREKAAARRQSIEE